MILPFHIAVATLSMGFAGWLYFRPSQSKLWATYITTALMLVSGFYLILSKPTHLTQTCITGLSFLAVVSYAIVSAKQRMPQD
ncbi:MAG: hypothetical protein KW802_00900 [Candidatus Doudnabacteria bacterium]|nr:hypothetical protein [Candidatus Doudnabacteria bacterium]